MLTKESRHLLEQIESIPFFAEWTHKVTGFSTTSRQFLQTFLENIRIVQIKWTAQAKKIFISRTDYEKLSPPAMKHFPPMILHSVRTELLTYCSFEFATPRRKVRLYLIFRPGKKIEDVVYKTFLWFSVVDGYTSKECSVEVDVYLYLSNHRKCLPEKEVLDSSHANTAFTTECQAKTTIYIYREEEWFKVLMHETFHNLGLVSFTDTMEKQANAAIQEMFHVKINARFYESYCETWATILHSLFFCAFSASDIPSALRLLQICLGYESMFSLLQTAKILRHYGITYSELISMDTVYQEKTNVFSYYVLKGILLVHYRNFLDFCPSLQFPVQKFDDYIGLIRHHYKKPLWLSRLEKMEKWLAKRDDSTLQNTLRMTAIEMK